MQFLMPSIYCTSVCTKPRMGVCARLVILVHWKEVCQGRVEAGLWAERDSLQAGLLLAQGVCWGPVELWVRWRQAG